MDLLQKKLVIYCEEGVTDRINVRTLCVQKEALIHTSWLLMILRRELSILMYKLGDGGDGVAYRNYRYRNYRSLINWGRKSKKER